MIAEAYATSSQTQAMCNQKRNDIVIPNPLRVFKTTYICYICIALVCRMAAILADLSIFADLL
eukprot:4003489-Pleurochrysis_carterae.AAC.1